MDVTTIQPAHPRSAQAGRKAVAVPDKVQITKASRDAIVRHARQHGLGPEFLGISVDIQRKDDGRYSGKPVYANSRENPNPVQPYVDGEAKARRPRTLTGGKRDKAAGHVGGEPDLANIGGCRPIYMMEAAHQVERCWMHAGWLVEMLGDYRQLQNPLRCFILSSGPPSCGRGLLDARLRWHRRGACGANPLS